MNNVLVVCNVDAGRRKAIKYKKKVVDFILKSTQSFKLIGLDDLESIDVSTFDTIFVLGGDGTVNKVLPYIINTEKKLAIIPCGTANLLAAKLGLSMNIDKTLKIIEKENIKKIDILSIGEQLCVLRCGFGYDADIIGKTPQHLKNKFGYFSYFIAGILFALRLHNKEYKMIIDDAEVYINASCIILANSANMYRNLVSVAYNSKPDDGLIDIFILKTTNPIDFFFEFICVIFNIKRNNKRAEYLTAGKISIENSSIFCHIDGEKKFFKDKIEISVLKKSINVISK